MRTILFNTETQEIKHHANEGYYKVRGKRPELPEPWVELEVENAARPTYDPETHELKHFPHAVDLQAKTYLDSYTVMPLSDYKIALRAWQYPEYALKLSVHGSVLFDSTGIAYRAYLEDRGFPVEMQEDGSYSIWLNDIEEVHQPFVTQLENNGLLTKTLRPEEDE